MSVYPNAHGTETVSDALKNSCNDALMQIAQKMGAVNFQKYQKLFGFGSRTGIDLPGEAAGVLFLKTHGMTQRLRHHPSVRVIM